LTSANQALLKQELVIFVFVLSLELTVKENFMQLRKTKRFTEDEAIEVGLSASTGEIQQCS
jgi:hypothetical protein